MITSNALGHFMYSRTKKARLDEAMQAWALENAMRTIHNAQRDPSSGTTKFAHCPATFLIEKGPTEATPLSTKSATTRTSPDILTPVSDTPMTPVLTRRDTRSSWRARLPRGIRSSGTWTASLSTPTQSDPRTSHARPAADSRGGWRTASGNDADSFGKHDPA